MDFNEEEFLDDFIDNIAEPCSECSWNSHCANDCFVEFIDRWQKGHYGGYKANVILTCSYCGQIDKYELKDDNID